MKKIIRKSKKARAIKLYFILSYFSLVVLAVITGSILYVKAETSIIAEIEQSRMLMIRQLKTEVDSWFSELNQTSLNVSNSSDVHDLLNASQVMSPAEILDAKDVIQDLKSIKYNHLLINDFYIYSIKRDKIINASSIYDAKYYYDNYIGYKGVGFEDWRDSLLDTALKNKYLTAAEINNPIIKDKMVSFFQGIPYTQVKNPSGILVILIDENDFLRRLNVMGAENTTLILDSNNNVMISNKPTEDIDFGFMDNSYEGDSIIEKTINDEDMIIVSDTSDVGGWKYVSIIPKKEFLVKARRIKNTTFWILIIYILIGVIVSLFLSYRNYHPIKLIFDMLSNGSSGEINYDNELDYIKKAVGNTLDKNKELEERNREITDINTQIKDRQLKNSPIIKASLLNNLANGNIKKQDEFFNNIQFYEVDLPHKQFVMLIIKSGAKTLIGNFLGEITGFMNSNIIFPENYLNYIFSYKNDSIAILYNFTDIDGKKSIKAIFDFAQSLNVHLEINYNFSIYSGIGNIYEGLDNVYKSTSEALKALEYRMVKGNTTICYNEVSQREDDYYYPVEFEMQFINSVKAGNFEKCNNLLDEVFNENFKKRELSIDLIKCLFFDIMSTVIKVLDSVSLNYSQIFNSQYDPIDTIVHCETIKEIYDEMIVIYKGICKYINDNKISYNHSLGANIVAYVRENYNNANISQTMISENFDITTSYLSKLFKQETNQHMVDYINGLRISSAKELLEKTNMSIKEIAKEVGCSNDKNLIRIFKQKEGITPGKYRNYTTSFQK